MSETGPRIGLYSRHFHNPLRRGLATYGYHLVHEMAHLLSDTRVVLSDTVWRRDQLEHLPHVANPHFSRRVVRLPGRVGDFLKRRLRWPLLEHFTGRLDLLHALHEEIPATRTESILMTVHGLGPVREPELFPGPIRRRWRESLDEGLERATRVIAVSETVAEQLRAYRPDLAHKFVATILGVSPVFLREPDPGEEDRFRNSLGIESPYLLFVGAADPNKNLAEFIGGFRELLLRNAGLPHHMVFVGRTDWGGYAQLKDLVNELSLSDRVHFTGYVEQDRLPALYRRAELFVFPALSEGFGLPLLEAMAAGAPCMVSDIAPFREIGGDRVAYFPGNSGDEIADGLERVLADPSRLASLGEAGRTHARQFTWQRTAEETLRLYGEVLGRPLS